MQQPGRVWLSLCFNFIVLADPIFDVWQFLLNLNLTYTTWWRSPPPPPVHEVWVDFLIKILFQDFVTFCKKKLWILWFQWQLVVRVVWVGFDSLSSWFQGNSEKTITGFHGNFPPCRWNTHIVFFTMSLSLSRLFFLLILSRFCCSL